MNNLTTALQKLPNGRTKVQFYKMYPITPDHIKRKRINTIIYEKRKDFPENKNKTKKDIIGTHSVERSELLEYALTYGFPNGYEED